ncbi:flagellar biosynthesis anti-sigma factor FlgM [Acidovorax radicis]|uniref:flagellar biosynthesis anti-sigma factor FlgM n=1 Tax=Acidovorax radicis TaxID=758826 RepID=UPI001CF81D73|nr:flagellar biosynthesis anti-sigma factor FlgM [Acidovorax radicis]UCU98745.1 flagellar biosynthesis anti-sigma factor FlgM [Acidovorax radicis]
MKIGQKPELPGALAQAGLAKQAKSPAVAAEGAAKDAVAKSAAGVPVTVSMAARALSPSSRTTGDFDASKVKSVRTAIEKGEFSVDAEAVADRMLSNAQEILSRSRG